MSAVIVSNKHAIFPLDQWRVKNKSDQNGVAAEFDIRSSTNCKWPRYGTANGLGLIVLHCLELQDFPRAIDSLVSGVKVLPIILELDWSGIVGKELDDAAEARKLGSESWYNVFMSFRLPVPLFFAGLTSNDARGWTVHLSALSGNFPRKYSTRGADIRRVKFFKTSPPREFTV